MFFFLIVHLGKTTKITDITPSKSAKVRNPKPAGSDKHKTSVKKHAKGLSNATKDNNLKDPPSDNTTLSPDATNQKKTNSSTSTTKNAAFKPTSNKRKKAKGKGN